MDLALYFSNLLVNEVCSATSCTQVCSDLQPVHPLCMSDSPQPLLFFTTALKNDLCSGRVLIGSALRWAGVCSHRCVSGAPRKCPPMYMSACWQREPCRWGPGHGAPSSAPNMCSGLPSPSTSASFEGPAEESAAPTWPRSNSLAFIHLTSSYLVRV